MTNKITVLFILVNLTGFVISTQAQTNSAFVDSALQAAFISLPVQLNPVNTNGQGKTKTGKEYFTTEEERQRLGSGKTTTQYVIGGQVEPIPASNLHPGVLAVATSDAIGEIWYQKNMNTINKLPSKQDQDYYKQKHQQFYNRCKTCGIADADFERKFNEVLMADLTRRKIELHQ